MLHPNRFAGHGYTAQELYENLAELLAQAEAAIDTDRRIASDCITRAAKLLPTMTTNALPIEDAPVNGGLAPWQTARLRRFVATNLADKINTPDLAAVVRLSVGHFARAFKTSFSMTPQAYLVGERINEAQRLMLETALPLCQIALECGMADQTHLCRAFRKVVGSTPAAWRRRTRTAVPFMARPGEGAHEVGIC